MECIILAGGLGTRLRSSIGDQPKCMAPVNEKPFLYFIFQYLERQQCERVVLSLGYKSETIISWIYDLDFSFEIDFVIEDEPMGTGGGIQLALKACTEPEVAVLNGDTFFDVPLSDLSKRHRASNALTTLALKELREYDRYGSVITDSTGRVLSFEEKRHTAHGTINGGVYIIDREAFLDKKLPERFSFEKDYLEAYVSEGRFLGVVQGGYFIDIGIPEDYQKAQVDFKTLFP